MATLAPAETDLLLLKRFVDDRDSGAFAEIVRRYAAMVFAACRRVVHDPALAEDVAQETFFRLMKRPDSVTQSLGAWLHQAATNLAVDAIRSDSARRRRERIYAEEFEANQEEVVEVDSWSELSPIVDEALQELPEDMRDLLVSHFLCGRPQNEMATEAGTSAATMCRRIKAAVDALQQKLRRRGVGIAPMAMVGLLNHHAIEAAPHTLVGELGKMTMVSGARSLLAVKSAAAAANPPLFWTAATILGASLGVGALCATLFGRGLPTLPVHSSPAPTARVIVDHDFNR